MFGGGAGKLPDRTHVRTSIGKNFYKRCVETGGECGKCVCVIPNWDDGAITCARSRPLISTSKNSSLNRDNPWQLNQYCIISKNHRDCEATYLNREERCTVGFFYNKMQRNNLPKISKKNQVSACNNMKKIAILTTFDLFFPLCVTP